MRLLRVQSRYTTLHCSSLAGKGASPPEVNAAEEPGPIKVHGKDVEKSSNKEEEASNQWERIWIIMSVFDQRNRANRTHPGNGPSFERRVRPQERPLRRDCFPGQGRGSKP